MLSGFLVSAGALGGALGLLAGMSCTLVRTTILSDFLLFTVLQNSAFLVVAVVVKLNRICSHREHSLTRRVPWAFFHSCDLP